MLIITLWRLSCIKNGKVCFFLISKYKKHPQTVIHYRPHQFSSCQFERHISAQFVWLLFDGTAPHPVNTSYKSLYYTKISYQYHHKYKKQTRHHATRYYSHGHECKIRHCITQSFFFHLTHNKPCLSPNTPGMIPGLGRPGRILPKCGRRWCSYCIDEMHRL